MEFHDKRESISGVPMIKRLKSPELQARGPHVARHSVFSGPRKHSVKIFQSEIC